MPGTLTVTGMSAGLASGQKVIGPVTTTGNALVGAINDTTLSIGDNVFTVPPGAVAVAIFLGLNAQPTVKLRTSANPLDGGVQIAPCAQMGWTKIDLVTGTTSITLNSSGALTGVELSWI